ncbi:MAG: hypothetical protein NZ534_12695, partial [Bacteroidia bacterium]|nr:hypothetical protein [Bacteroidia bacterium]
SFTPAMPSRSTPEAGFAPQSVPPPPGEGFGFFAGSISGRSEAFFWDLNQSPTPSGRRRKSGRFRPKF